MIRVALGLVILAGTGLIVNELCGWLELVPRGILRLAAMRLPADLRQTIYKEEWLPELLCHLREAEGRPITRLIVGIKYAADMIRGARSVGRELEGVRWRYPQLRQLLDALKREPDPRFLGCCAMSLDPGVGDVRRLGGPLPSDWPQWTQFIRDGGLFDPVTYPREEPDQDT